MVIDVGAALAGEFDAVRADIAAVRDAVPGATLKVIVESAALLELRAGRRWPTCAGSPRTPGADFVKTSTGFHPCGGASVRAVELMAGAVDGRLGVKASGGIRTAAQAAGDAATPVPRGSGCRARAPCWTALNRRFGLQTGEAGVLGVRSGWSRSGSKSGPSHRYPVTCTLSA